MNQAIIKRMLSEGILVSPETLKKITNENIDDFIEKHKKAAQTVVCEKKEKHENSMRMEMRKFSTRKKMSTEDFVIYYNKRYSGIRDLLQKKGNAMSINNAKKSFSEVSVIGMVRERNMNGFTIEDETGEIDVYSKEAPPEDDVVMVTGAIKEGRLFASDISNPDVPLTGNIPTIENTSLYLVNGTITPPANEEDFVVFASDEEKRAGGCSIFSIPNPAWIYLDKNNSKILVLVYSPKNEASNSTLISYIKRRHLFPDNTMIKGTDDPFLLNPVPDILWVPSKNSFFENYKGTTLVSGKGVKIDLGTRQVEFLS